MSNYKVEHLSLSLYKVLCFLLQLSWMGKLAFWCLESRALFDSMFVLDYALNPKP
jgi:hypothetical protein